MPLAFIEKICKECAQTDSSETGNGGYEFSHYISREMREDITYKFTISIDSFSN